ncbi:MAG: hypothetical protein ACJAYU_003238 [Bradymonadia bacterium]|jgi:hypothetical protein
MNDEIKDLKGEEIIEWIRSEKARSFRYKPNVPGAWFLIVSGSVTLGMAALLAYQSGLILLIHKIGFSILTAFTLWAFYTVGRWTLFAVRTYVAVSPEALLIGSGANAKVVPRSSLSTDTVKIENMQRGKLTSVLPIVIGSFKSEVHLIGPFANMNNVQQFIAEILAALLPAGESTEAEEASP